MSMIAAIQSRKNSTASKLVTSGNVRKIPDATDINQLKQQSNAGNVSNASKYKDRVCIFHKIEDGRTLFFQPGGSKTEPLNDREVIALLRRATLGSTITAQVLWSWLELDDIADIQAGICNLEQLRCYVLSRARSPEAFPAENKKPFPEPNSLK